MAVQAPPRAVQKPMAVQAPPVAVLALPKSVQASQMAVQASQIAREEATPLAFQAPPEINTFEHAWHAIKSSFIHSMATVTAG